MVCYDKSKLVKVGQLTNIWHVKPGIQIMQVCIMPVIFMFAYPHFFYLMGTYPCLPQGIISTTCTIILVWRNDRKLKLTFMFLELNSLWQGLTHWCRVTNICISKLTIIGSDNGLPSGRCQAIIWTSAGILLIRTLGTNFSVILSEILTFSFREMHLKMSAKQWRFCLNLNVLNFRCRSCTYMGLH